MSDPKLDTEFDLSSSSKNLRTKCLTELKKDTRINNSLIDLLIKIEDVPASLQEYRQRDIYLDQLSKELGNCDISKLEFSHTCALRYLLGSLYINFEKFWGPTIRAIKDLIDNAKFRTRLLDILIYQLKITNEYIYGVRKINPDDQTPSSRPDHVLHRNFIFQLLSHHVSFVEKNHVLFINEFLLFVEKEIRRYPFTSTTSSTDLTSCKSDCEQLEDEDHLEDSRINSVVDHEIRVAVPNHRFKRHIASKSKKRKVPLSESAVKTCKSRETLITASKIIQSFSNIANIHREPELRQLIFDLLKCRDIGIQKVAFNCLCAYKHEFLDSYRDNIRNLLDAKQVRAELSVFSVADDGSSHIQRTHRKEVIPIVQRIIFGRMISHIGKKTKGKDNSDKRKDLVMRFVAGCSDDEIRDFFRLLFEPYHKYLCIDYNSLESKLQDDLNIKQYVALNKLQAMIDTLEAFMKSIGHLQPNLLSDLLKLVNVTAYFVMTPIENPELVEKIARNQLTLLKNVRRSLMQSLLCFLRTYEYYPYSQGEIDFIFNQVIWPYSKGFVDRNHATVTPMIRIISCFCNNRVYHNLLIKRNKLNADEYLLNHLVSLYSEPKTDRIVIKAISDMIADLLNAEHHSEDDDRSENLKYVEDVLQIEDKDARIPEYDSTMFEIDAKSMPRNHLMLVRYIPTILERLRQTCQTYLTKKDVNYQFQQSELMILSSLSAYLRHSDHCISATRLLLSTFDNLKNHDTIIATLKAAQSLMKRANCVSDRSIIKTLANLLYYQYNSEQRYEMCCLLEILSNIDDRLIPACKAIKYMNSMSEEYVEVPDFTRLNEGFRVAFNYFEGLSTQEVNQAEHIEDSFILLLHQVGFIINSIDKYDFSVRNNCLIFYERFSTIFKLVDISANRALSDLILGDIVLDKFIKRGLRSNNDMIKHLYLSVIRTLALNCHEHHTVLSEFKSLCNKNTDLDFWLGLGHIQLHNRSKALARLANDKNLQRLSITTQSSYLLPIASGFLYNKNYKSLPSIVDCSIKIIGTICRNLQWRTYESTLNHYLSLLTKSNATYQRTSIQLITEIVRNFDFDLTACEEAMQFREENERLAKRMFKRLGPLEHKPDENSHGHVGSKKLSPVDARVIYTALMERLIPRLSNCLHDMTRAEFEHDKKMVDCLSEKDEIKRVPVAFAIVQLLTLLPCKYILLRDHLPPIFLKLASFLKSRNEKTRKISRATLIRIMKFVGPLYIVDMLRILRQSLDKGFYIHVLNYTVNSVLENMSIDYGDLDNSALQLMEMCLQEIFGKPSEDKEVAQLIAKTSEAKKTKSYDTIFILASHISCDKLDSIIMSLKSQLQDAHDPKNVNKLSMCIQKVFTGLTQNDHYPLDEMLQFIEIIIQDSIPSIKKHPRMKGPHDSIVNNNMREDRYLIENDKTIYKLKSRINERGNSHMLVENSLRLLLSTFEKNKAHLIGDVHLQNRLDNFVKLLTTCLKSSSPRCVMRSLKCLCFIAQTEIDLPIFKVKCNSIVKKLFTLLSLYNGVGMVKGDNHEMIGMCFRTLSLILMSDRSVSLDSKQIRALLTYIEQDLNDATRQTTALKTLYSLVKRKCNSPELGEILNKVAETLVTSSDESLRIYSIKIWQTYLLEYNHEGDRLQVFLTKFLRQLEYDYIDGRKSVLKMLRVIVEKFTEDILRDHFELFFYLLAQRVVNDESKEIRSQVGHLIALLMHRLPDKQAFVLNKFIFPWSICENLGINILGIKLLSVLIEACPDQFIKNKDRINRMLNIISKALVSNGTHESMSNAADGKNLAPNSQRLSYHSLRLFKRLLDKEIISYVDALYIDQLKNIWKIISQSKLTDEYEPVVLTSCMLYMQFLNKTDLVQALTCKQPSKEDYIGRNATRIILTLSDKLIELLNRFHNENKIHNYVVQTLMLIGKMVSISKTTRDFELGYQAAFSDQTIIEHLLTLDDLPPEGFIMDKLPCSYAESKKNVNLMWLSIKIVMQARKEVALYRQSNFYVREFVLRWIAAIAQELGPKRIEPYVALFMMVPTRELTERNNMKIEKNSKQNLISMSEDLLKFIKSLIDIETFNGLYAKIQLFYTRRRVNRKMTEAIQKVKDQNRGVKRKLALRKKEATKKRKGKDFKISKRLTART